MKKLFFLILCLFIAVTISAQDYYTIQWENVRKQASIGQQKSLLPTIQEIQKRAMKDKNTLQIIKSLKEEYTLLNYDNDEKNDLISRLYAKLDSINTTLKGKDEAVFYFFKGKFVKEYFENNQWKISKRTNLASDKLGDIETWTTLDFKNYLENYYKSLHYKANELETVSLSSYKDILDIEHNTIPYFQNFYQWSRHEEISFLTNSNFFKADDLKKNKVKIDDLFSQLVTSDSDPNSQLFFKKLKLDTDAIDYRKMIDYQPYIDLYRQAENIEYKINLAAFIAEKYLWYREYKNAYDFIQKAKKEVAVSRFMPNLLEIESQITEQKLSPTLKEEVQANRSIPLILTYKNMEEVSFNIYSVSKSDPHLLKYLWNRNKHNLPQKTLVRNLDYKLKKSDDFQEQLTILEIEPLPKGLYILEYPSANKQGSNSFFFTVTDSRIILGKTNGEDEKNKFRLVNNEIGTPFTNSKVKVSLFDGKEDRSEKIGLDKYGEFSLTDGFDNSNYQPILIENLSTGDFNIFNRGYDSNYDMKRYAYNEDENKDIIQIFTDRSIYRPGQIVYFKAITIGKKNGKSNVMRDRTQTVLLKDTNNNELSSQKLQTNEFGSISGQFVLPTGRLNGNFRIEVIDDFDKNIRSSDLFKVEEYKRPQFEITFDPLEGEYKLGQKTFLKGSVTSFSGVPLSDADVNFEILKKDLRRQYFYLNSSKTNYYNPIIGTVKTDKDGKFVIEVDLNKDNAIKDGIQIFGFEVLASLTDANGETQSANTVIKAASTSYYFSATMLDNQFSDEEIMTKVSIKNYSDKDVKKDYQLKLSKFEGDERVLISLLIGAVQKQPYFSKKEFVKKFPHIHFDDNDLPFKNNKLKIFDRKESSNEVNIGRLSPGNYELEWYNVEGNDTIKAVQNFTVYSKSGLVKDQKPFLNVIFPKNDLKAKDDAKFYVYSAVPNAQVEIISQHDDNTETHEFKSLKNGLLIYQKIVPDNVETFNIQFRLVAYNDIQTKGRTYNVKSEDKSLQVNLVTFRDKLQPNQKEKWKVVISGKDKEKVQAELLATMYDKSLDKFVPHTLYWKLHDDAEFRFVSFEHFQKSKSFYYTIPRRYHDPVHVQFPDFNWFNGGGILLNSRMVAVSDYTSTANESGIREVVVTGAMGIRKKESLNSADAENSVVAEGISITEEVKVRENFNETAFFYPNLQTDAEGNVILEFTSPEALTTWKLSLLAHTKDARASVLTKDIITQKEFSITPNYPRFLREGDDLVFQTKISSLLDKNLEGAVTVTFYDAKNNLDITSQLLAGNQNQNFYLASKGSTSVSWRLKVPSQIEGLVVKIVAKAGDYSDGEQKIIPILPNRILVTESQPIFVKEGDTKTFVIENLAKAKSKSILNVSNTLELTTNPIWEVIFALPSLKLEGDNSADVVFNKWFADVVASEIFQANPKLKTVFDEYKNKDLLKSNLEKNQELKQFLLEETPWVFDSESEEEQMQKIAVLFDTNTMRFNVLNDWKTFTALQNYDGGFAWTPGSPSSLNTSLYILNQLGKINGWLKEHQKQYHGDDYESMVKKLITYVDTSFNQIWKNESFNNWTNTIYNYLDTRRKWETVVPLPATGSAAKEMVIKDISKSKFSDFTFYGLHRLAILLNDYDKKEWSDKLLTYLKETSTTSKTQGIYWKNNLNNWGWYHSKLLNHAEALEAFNLLRPTDSSFIEELKIWLVTQKEGNSWDNSRATAEVIYLLLNSGKSWTTTESDKVEIKWDGKNVEPENKITGYIKQSIKTPEINKGLSSVTVTKTGPGIAQGGVFWQYYEDMDKVKSSENYISIAKEFYKKIKTSQGEELRKITSNDPLKVGDRVTVRLVLNSDRTMEYVHLKDVRPAGLEPLDVLSGYQWKNSLRYYQSTKDASTNFYIEYFPKGKYIFEYDLVCNAEGSFSSGAATLQNYYAPQMNAHTNGNRIEITAK